MHTTDENKDLIIRKLNDQIRSQNTKLTFLSHKENENRRTLQQNKKMQEKIGNLISKIKQSLSQLNSRKNMLFGKREELNLVNSQIKVYEEILTSLQKSA